MKVPTVSAALAFTLVGYGMLHAATDTPRPIQPIAQILADARDEQPVAFEGVVSRQLDEDLYYIRDASGEIRLDAWVEGRGAVALPRDQTLRIEGVMDRAALAKPEVYLREFHVVNTAESTQPDSPSGATDATPGNESKPAHALPTIRELRKNAPDGATVTFRGDVLRMRGDDAYLIGDGTASIKLDAWVYGRGFVPLPVGEHVEITGIMDRSFLGKREIYLRSFTVVPKPQTTTDG